MSTLANCMAKAITEEDIKGIQIGKEELTLSLFSDDMILQIEHPKDSTRKLLVVINECVKITKYKINRQKSLAFLFTNKKGQKEKLRKQSPLALHQKE